MKNTRKIIVDVLDAVLYKGAYSNIILNVEFNKKNIEDKDKALITEIVYGTLKYKYTIDIILSSFIKKGIKSVDKSILNVLRSAIYQIKYLDKVPNFASVNEAVELAKKYSSIATSRFVNGVLRNYLRNLDKKYAKEKDKVSELSFKYSFEPWMVKKIMKDYDSNSVEKILQGLNYRPCVTVRVNGYKSNYDDVWEKLENENYNIEEGAVCPEAIKIRNGKSIKDNPLFKDGLITVQDESAMCVAPAMELKENMVVLDLCSAPGGKTTHIAEIMNNTGIIKAFDIHQNKLSLVKENAKRLGITNIKCEELDAQVTKKELLNIADRVLIDVPCSGIGIIRKKPEIKWTKNNKELKSIVNIQRNIMENATKYVKKDGIILYSTCTLNKDENEKNIKWFINKYPEFTIEKLDYGNADNIRYNEEGTVTILPSEFMDGFFIAKLRKLR